MAAVAKTRRRENSQSTECGLRSRSALFLARFNKTRFDVTLPGNLPQGRPGGETGRILVTSSRPLLLARFRRWYTSSSSYPRTRHSARQATTPENRHFLVLKNVSSVAIECLVVAASRETCLVDSSPRVGRPLRPTAPARDVNATRAARSVRLFSPRARLRRVDDDARAGCFDVSSIGRSCRLGDHEISFIDDGRDERRATRYAPRGVRVAGTHPARSMFVERLV